LELGEFVKIDASGLQQKFKQLIDSVDPNKLKDTYTDLARQATDIMYKRVKSGYGVDNDKSDNPQKQKLLELSNSYKQVREGRIRFFIKNGRVIPWRPGKGEKFKSPVTGEFGSARRSNLTLTGQMLNAITYRTTREGFKLYIDNTIRSGDNKTNAQVAGYVRERRPFFALTGGEQRTILKQFTDSILRLLINIK
jgi:hypothetical protein